MCAAQANQLVLSQPRYNHYRLPLIRSLLSGIYTLERLTHLRVWNVQRALDRVLPGRGAAFRLLDLGCGLGDYIFLYADVYPSAEFLGVDLVEDNVQMCRAYQDLRKLHNATFERGDLSQFVPEEKVDVLLCITVLQYVDDVARALRNAHDAIRDGGVLVMYQDVYDGYSEQPFAPAALHRINSERQNKYTSAQVLSYLVNAGFVVDTAQFCQGATAGRVEALLKLFLNTAKRQPWLALLLVPLAAALCPIYLLALWLDYRTTHTTGEGLLVVAWADAAARERRKSLESPGVPAVAVSGIE